MNDTDFAPIFVPADYWAYDEEYGWTWMGPVRQDPNVFMDELYPFSEPEVAGFRSYPLESGDSCVGYVAGFCWAQPEDTGPIQGFEGHDDLPF